LSSRRRCYRTAGNEGDSEQEDFADGLTEDIITGLSHQQWFFVPARVTSSFRVAPSILSATLGPLRPRVFLRYLHIWNVDFTMMVFAMAAAVWFIALLHTLGYPVARWFE